MSTLDRPFATDPGPPPHAAGLAAAGVPAATDVSAAAPTTADLADVVARASGRMLAGGTIRAVLELLTATAVHVVPHASGAGMTVGDDRSGPVTAAGTDPVVEHADRQQYELHEGPCLDAWAQRAVVRVDDLLDEPRWPRWAPMAAALGLRSALSAPLVAGDDTVGAIKVYSPVPHAFGPPEEKTMSLFAAQAAVLVGAATAYQRAGRLDDELRAALNRREIVDRATGILMGRDRVPAASAFAHLVAMSRRDGQPVHEVAQRLVSTAGRRR